MHGIAPTNFVSTAGVGIKISYHNGTSATTGYIVKQTGTNTFIVTSNGSVFFTVSLAQDTASATTLTAGFATILITPHGGGSEHVRNITTALAYTTEGNTFRWQKVATTAAGQGLINLM